MSKKQSKIVTYLGVILFSSLILLLPLNASALTIEEVPNSKNYGGLILLSASSLLMMVGLMLFIVFRKIFVFLRNNISINTSYSTQKSRHNNSMIRHHSSGDHGYYNYYGGGDFGGGDSGGGGAGGDF